MVDAVKELCKVGTLELTSMEICAKIYVGVGAKATVIERGPVGTIPKDSSEEKYS